MDGTLLVIGYGNPLRGDDGLGWRAAERLAAEARAGVDVIACQQLTPELAEPISRAARVLFLDARAGGIPGALVCGDLRPRDPEASAFSHYLDPAGLLALARQWYGHAPEAELITVSGKCFDCAEALSPAVETALESVIRLVKAL